MTNSVSILAEADNILVLKDGKLTESGSLKQLVQSNGSFAEFLSAHSLEEKNNIAEKGM